MKGEYRDQKSNEMFSKLPQHQQQQQHSLTSHFHLSSTAATPTVDDSSIEVVRRPRGRPPGSKNKPKPPVFVTRDTDPPMSPYILEVPSGNDVVEAINRFCRRKSIGVCVLSGSGSVANVTLRQPSPAAPGSTITFHGKFDLLSVSATFLPPPPRTSLSPPVSNFFTVSLAGPQGQIIGGFVAGPLISAGTVYVIAASFNNPSYHRLPADEEQKHSAGTGEREGQSPAVSGGGEESGQMAGNGGESCGVSMYSCHMGGSDVIWAPTARAPPPF
ncbi:PREDICTED: AT-hook motif nuclear-localized protein 17 [Camelina sativa]|uniref:AT-hook motif nuclear-localized protein n=1 Tax=Camelina sativa TaxID=90675 RepID=A0ABM0UKE9_CAMSA|nr:PREDICTED: AT-hook motif nuclear-localized protein 17 [Camelina sativa]XP_010442439.1 PREDICTED: AT-hook motif nuclear-localized protein 17 [Camelina sativa]